MGARLEKLDWMSPATKAEAIAKLQNFGLKIGHPDKWRDYSGLTVVNGDLFGNAARARAFEWDFRRARIGKPVDEPEWGMTSRRRSMPTTTRQERDRVPGRDPAITDCP